MIARASIGQGAGRRAAGGARGRAGATVAAALLASGTALAAAAFPGEALAAGVSRAGVFTPPAGCDLFLTVQERACSVAQHYRCSADPAGDQRTAYFGKDGAAVFVSHIDAETRWLESEDPRTGTTDRLQPGEADAASIAALLAQGQDSFDFWTIGNDGLRLHHVGADRLTGERVTIDGVTLLRTEFHMTTSDASGRLAVTRTGHQHVSPDLRLFFGGPEREAEAGAAPRPVDNSPVQFIRPGQPGFASTEPQYDCDLLTASLGAAG